jgi:hypothetical protein
MASGFIIFTDGSCFAPRWTAFDGLLRIAIRELYEIEKESPFAAWLEMRIPECEDIGDREMGWGFIDSRIDDHCVSRILDLRSLTSENQALFRKAIVNGHSKLISEGDTYSRLRSGVISHCLKIFDSIDLNEPPLEHSNWGKIADPCTEKNGPGWPD